VSCKRPPQIQHYPQAQSFESSVMPLVPQLRRKAQQFTRSSDAEDLLQETLLRAWKAWGRYEVKNVWAWLWLIMRNTHFTTCRDASYRRRQTENHKSEIADVRSPPPPRPDAGVTAGPDDDLLRAVNALPPSQRQVIELQLQGLDIQDVADRLGTNRNSTKTTSSKARAKIRAVL
jgi:RNA polymerase sigma-70 factor (ECF subfamily)